MSVLLAIVLIFGFFKMGVAQSTSLAAWGRNNSGQLNVPTLVGGSVYTQVAAGNEHTIGLRSDGTIAAWGDGSVYQTAVPTLQVGITFTKIASGSYHNLALCNDGTVRAWGWVAYGNHLVPPGLGDVVSVAAGANHCLALRANGSVVAWGRNEDGECNVPLGLTGVVKLAGGFGYSLALLNTGTLVGWGSNDYGQRTPPMGLPAITDMAAGFHHTVARCIDGSVHAWGEASWSQLQVPALPPGTTYAQVSAGGSTSGAIRSDGTVVIWGNNEYGQAAVPSGLQSVLQFDVGGHHVAAIGYSPIPPNPYTASLVGPANVSIGTIVPIAIITAAPFAFYVMDVGVAGTFPGVSISPGITLPLNPPFLRYEFGAAIGSAYPNMFQGFVGVSGGTGVASASMQIPNEPSIVGANLTYAAVTFGSWIPTFPFGINGVSNAVTVSIVP